MLNAICFSINAPRIRHSTGFNVTSMDFVRVRIDNSQLRIHHSLLAFISLPKKIANCDGLVKSRFRGRQRKKFEIAARKSRGMQRNKDTGLFAKPSIVNCEFSIRHQWDLWSGISGSLWISVDLWSDQANIMYFVGKRSKNSCFQGLKCPFGR